MNASHTRPMRVWTGAVLALALLAQSAAADLFGRKKPQDDEVWAIRCIAVPGKDRQRIARTYAEQLKKVRGLKADLVLVIDDEQESVVYYGRYKREYDSRTGQERFKPDHLRDMQLIRDLNVQNTDVWPFLLATMDVLPPVGSPHPEWELRRVRNAEAYWSLHVAVFYNNQEMRSRRSAAEEYCKLLREQGEEAYYDHGPAHSSVYVGLFPRSAITEVRREDPLTGSPVFVNKIVDERMLALQRKYPFTLHNGHRFYEVVRDPSSGAVREKAPTPSFPVILPQAESAGR